MIFLKKKGLTLINALLIYERVRNMIKYLAKQYAVYKLITGHGKGYFCKFTVNGRIMKALFTNNHVLKEDLIKEN